MKTKHEVKTRNPLKFVFGVLMVAIGVLILGWGVNSIFSNDSDDAASNDDANVSSNSFCSSFEIYDEDSDECYYECDTDQECDEIEAKIDSELSGVLDEYEANDKSYNAGESSDIETSYVVSGITLNPAPEDQQHQEVWDMFLKIADEDFLQENVSQFGVFSDTDSDTAAYVEQTEDDYSKWSFNVNLDAVYIDGSLDNNEAKSTIVHEFAHILTLRSEQVPPEAGNDEATCQTFYTGEGCSVAGSYISAFYGEFWADIYDELPQDAEDVDAVDNFYEKYQDQFVTDYAATNPGEDIAESFTYFVFDKKPEGSSIADEKQRFFYDYSELVELRDKVRAGFSSQRTAPN